MEISRQKVVIVGGSSGIGLASASTLSHEGYPVIITARTRERMDAALDRIGGTASGRTLDYADAAGI